MEAREQLIDFAQRARGLDERDRLKLILVAAGVKPATFVALKISPENLEEKAHLERHLKACAILFSVGRPRAYEEIASIRGNAVQWRIKGCWYGYDVFAGKKQQREFQKYLGLLRQQKHAAADRTAGKIYEYPRCCVEHYIKEHDIPFLRNNYTHYSYYKHVHDSERAFPLLMHTTCSAHCAASKLANSKYASALKKHAPGFWKRFSAAKTCKVDVVVDTESELLQDVVYGIRSTAPVFPSKDGHEYSLVTLKPLGKHNYLLHYLAKQHIERGTVLPAIITTRYQHADVKLGKPKRTIKNLHHERHFVLL